ncbi:glycoside hydrolase family 32 protein [Isoptericola sp. 4D.3]|uniref:Glycoside hydrolase family 32 protein n=1 Tax=Isoptericola peretonis TaxID=2918523 RepID=A0ABT0J187_9MICO|nr:glycoside hydrolase family 32 protein [Isoptericola sp. 4D.3]
MTDTTVDRAQDRATAHLRPAAHFTARDTWLNDPNGLVLHDGTWHLFFQNNPHGATHGNMSWGHATSDDLVSWTEQPVAIRHTATEEIFSGSAVVDEKNTAGFAGPGQTALVAVYTSAYRPAHPTLAGRQAQSLAYSLDDGRTWTRYAGNPVLDRGSADFRDPKVFWYDGEDGEGHWVMVAVEATDRQVVMYRSADLKHWEHLSTFGPAHATGGVWECPDLFPLPVRGTRRTRWVMIVSLNPGGVAGGSGAQYFVGDFDGTTFTPERPGDGPHGADWLDHGRDYYAPVSFNGVSDGRRLTVGWASNWDYANETPTSPWRSTMSLARELTLVRTSDGRDRVAQRPVLPEEAREGLSVHELRLPADGRRRHEIVLHGDGPDEVVLTVDAAARTLVSDRRRSGDTAFHPAFPSVDTAPLHDVGETVDVTVVVDGCVLEVYACGGLTTLTQVVFPTAPLTQVAVRETTAG